MKRVAIDPTDLLAVAAVVGIGVGAYLVAGIGWAVLVVSVIVLVYTVLPDQREVAP